MVESVNGIIGLIFIACYFYQIVYIFIPKFIKRENTLPVVMHNFAVLISARNESAVISYLIDSIKRQSYPAEYIHIFVCADNCTDNTAQIAREAGATVYERFNNELVGKGYALSYLTACIDRDFGDIFDGYFVFDADNVLDKNYIKEMNVTFSQGYNIITSYRNSKNYGDNWISAGYALWFLRESMYLNRPRHLLGTSCAVSGTGFVFSNEILKKCGGWNFFLLTEDIQFSVHNILQGEKIGFCEKAVLYDEQPVKFSQSWRQRLRWSRGYLQVFGKYGASLVKKLPGCFSAYDMLMTIMPAFFLAILSTVFNGTMMVLNIMASNSIGFVLVAVLRFLKDVYGFMFFIGAITTVTQWKQIHTTVFKKIFYTFTFPFFMFTYIPISIQAIFTKVSWKPIEHKVSVSIDSF